ncbi:MAG TPA: nuclear transport factor 2 family protein [Acidimicrobiales bacterium]|nr:nuclear transport factor 2 family protein [Acidimicrobiales bacterium]
MTEHEQFVDRHIQRLLARDLDDVMQDYQPDVVVRSGGHEYRGIEAVRSHLEAALAAAPSESRLDYEIETQADGQVTLAWRLFTAKSAEAVMHGHDVFRFHEGRIAEQDVVIAD